MEIETIIFNIMRQNAHNWVRYFLVEKMSGLTFPGEYIEIRTGFMSGDNLSELFASGFKLDKISSQKVNADCYFDMLFKRDISHKPITPSTNHQ